jgi:membrane associated rhomboid family serine protease
MNIRRFKESHMIPLKDNLSCKVFPWFTLLLLALNGIAFALELSVPQGQLKHVLSPYLVHPDGFMHALSSGSITAIALALLSTISASFLHGGWSHIIGNMIFLQAFSRSVEARLGTLRYAAFYLLSCVAAWSMFAFSAPGSAIPGLGASAPIAAVMAAYLAFYPRAQFKTIIPLTGWPLWAIVPAWSFLGVWTGQQFLSGYFAIIDPGAADGVAVWAHIGGFLFGFIAAGAYALLTPDTGICYVPIDCGHNCDNEKCTKKHHQQRFRFASLPDWLVSLLKKVRLPKPVRKSPCDEDDDHNHHDQE